MPADPRPVRVRFGPFIADRLRYTVERDGAAVAMTAKLLDVLFHLIDRPAELVTKEALLDAVWPGANVTDNALAQAISELRDALGDSAASPQYIRTVARRGYRFIAPVERVDDPPAASPTAGVVSAVAPTSHVPAAGDRQTLVVTDFVNVTGDSDVAWLGAGIAETVTSDLAALDRFVVVDRWRAAQAVRAGNTAPEEVARAVGASLVVAGSYQRSGPRLRITARIVEVATGRTLADVKVDGAVQDVFTLQDTIAAALGRHLGVAAPPRRAGPDSRETASLDAYRAYTEGVLTLESLDTTRIGEAIRDFSDAIRLDPQYAIAFTGLANAEVVAYEMTRAHSTPDLAVLRSGVEHARHAASLDERLAEAHATLSFLLTCHGQFDDAQHAAQRAVLLEPDAWRHWYRLGHALWGDARLRALDRALAIYPRFPYAHFERVMVFVARSDLDTAAAGLREFSGAHRSGSHGDRFPGVGFHWLVGALHFARDDVPAAREAFARELAEIDRRLLYAPEYAAATLTWRGYLEAGTGDLTAAAATFDAALAEIAGYPRALLGHLVVARAAGDRGRVTTAEAALDRSFATLEQHGRHLTAMYLTACRAAIAGALDDAATRLSQVLERTPASFVGWTMPIDPMLRPLRGHPGFAELLSRLAARAR